MLVFVLHLKEICNAIHLGGDVFHFSTQQRQQRNAHTPPNYRKLFCNFSFQIYTPYRPKG